MADASANPPQIQGNLPLYTKPEPLSAEMHKGKGLKYTDRPFDFLAGQHFIPLTVGEFGAAGARFPIIFLGEQRTPVAAMGINAGQNLFVDPETGQFERHTYLPAYVRRYPFVAAAMGENADRYTVCVDAGSHLFSDKPDQPFFNESGEPTEFTNRAVEFVQRFESDIAATNQFVERMKELDLFDEQSARFQPRDAGGQPTGDPQVVATYWALTGEKLRKLSPETLVELRDNTYLGAIYAHMLSMSQWDMVIERAVARQNGMDGAAAAPPPPPSPDA